MFAPDVRGFADILLVGLPVSVAETPADRRFREFEALVDLVGLPDLLRVVQMPDGWRASRRS